MTEAEWLAIDGPEDLLEFIWDRVGDRKARLFACACCRSIGTLLPDWASANLEALERMADSEAEFKSAGWFIPDQDTPAEYAVDLAGWQGAKNLEVLAEVAHWACEAFARPTGGADSSSEGDEEEDREGRQGDPYLRLDEMARQAHLVRDIFGNPFRPVAFAPGWRTETALALAQQMYDSRDFSAMPILADALQDAGCNSDDILAHCRDANQPHVRGCWVVDLVLGKE